MCGKPNWRVLHHSYRTEKSITLSQHYILWRFNAGDVSRGPPLITRPYKKQTSASTINELGSQQLQTGPINGDTIGRLVARPVGGQAQTRIHKPHHTVADVAIDITHSRTSYRTKRHRTLQVYSVYAAKYRKKSLDSGGLLTARGTTHLNHCTPEDGAPTQPPPSNPETNKGDNN